jgi:hypothetical protein
MTKHLATLFLSLAPNGRPDVNDELGRMIKKAAYSKVLSKHSPDGSGKMPQILVENRMRDLEIYF